MSLAFSAAPFSLTLDDDEKDGLRSNSSNNNKSAKTKKYTRNTLLSSLTGGRPSSSSATPLPPYPSQGRTKPPDGFSSFETLSSAAPQASTFSFFPTTDAPVRKDSTRQYHGQGHGQRQEGSAANDEDSEWGDEGGGGEGEYDEYSGGGGAYLGGTTRRKQGKKQQQQQQNTYPLASTQSFPPPYTTTPAYSYASPLEPEPMTVSSSTSGHEVPQFSSWQPNRSLADHLQQQQPHEDPLTKKINYILALLEAQQDERTEHVAEEVVLYSFLGIFIIFVADSLVRFGRYRYRL